MSHDPLNRHTPHAQLIRNGLYIELTEEPDTLSIEPSILFAQAQRVGQMRIRLEDASELDRAGMSADDSDLRLLYFARTTESAGKPDGCELVAYGCDSLGRVRDWSQRYRLHEVNLTVAIEKLHFMVVNGQIEMGHIENEITTRTPEPFSFSFRTGALD